VARIVIQETQRLSPLVAVQPIYMHPYSIRLTEPADLARIAVRPDRQIYNSPLWLPMVIVFC
jgi:hypothetical protein